MAAAVRGPKHVVKTGKTPVLDGKEWRTLIDSIPTDTLRDLRDRALIATLHLFVCSHHRGAGTLTSPPMFEAVQNACRPFGLWV